MKHKMFAYHKQWFIGSNNEPELELFCSKLPNHIDQHMVRIFIQEVEVDVEVDLLNERIIKQCMIDGFRKEQSEIQATAFKDVKILEEKIQQLLCLENKEE